MKIAIYGAGAMGTVLGAYLWKNGCPVDMVNKNKEKVLALRENGATITGYANFTVPVRAIFPEEMDGDYDLIFLMTKQTANPTVLPFLKTRLSEKGIVCTMQNGVPDLSVAEIIGKDRTIGAAMMWGASYIAPGVFELTTDIEHQANVLHRPLFNIGEINGEITERVQAAADILSIMGPAKVSDHLLDTRWNKLVINCCGSGMSAVTGSAFGAIIDNPRAMDCLRNIAYEVAIVALAAKRNIGEKYTKILLNEEKCKAFYYGIYDVARTGKASMLQDLEAGRLTEVDMLSGHVCKTGRELGIATPYNDKVVEIVHGIEQGIYPLSPENVNLFPTFNYPDKEL